MDVMRHCSSFLLPSPSSVADTDGRPPPAYALVLLNQRLPRFTPLLWEHEQHRYVCVPTGARTACTTKCLTCSRKKTLPLSETGLLEKFAAQFPVNYTLYGTTVLPRYLFILSDLHQLYKPEVIKGDMDSIRTEVMDFYRKLGTKIVDESHDQDTTDLHKCVSYIRDSTPELDKSNLCILVAGALGGRFDHEIGNINVLCRFSDMRIILISDDCLILLLPRTHHHEIHILSSVEGPHCGLIPIGIPSKSTATTGLQWDIADTEMKFGGLISTSNIAREETVTVRSDSDLLWTISIKKP